MNFGEKLSSILESREISQKEFAYTLNIAPSTLNGYIKNRRQPDFETLRNMALVLNVSIDFLLEHNESGSLDITAREISLVSKLRNMDKKQRDIIYDLVNIVAVRNNK